MPRLTSSAPAPVSALPTAAATKVSRGGAADTPSISIASTAARRPRLCVDKLRAALC